MMPGGSDAAWPHVKDIFQSICAKADGEPCCDWVGQQGSGHYVKQTHNGIEYGDMQMITEVYSIMRSVGMSCDEIADVMDRWNQGVLDSFLIEITAQIFRTRDPQTGGWLVDSVLDKAAQKGTGKWTSQSSLDLGIPVTAITEAVFARCLSALKDQRVAASRILTGPTAKFAGNKDAFITDIRDALYARKAYKGAAGSFGFDKNGDVTGIGYAVKQSQRAVST